jgi:hypothetical protein
MNNNGIFDRVVGGLDGLPDVRHTKPTTIASVLPMLGNMQTFVVQTYRQRDVGDTILLQFIDGDGGDRIVIPPKVAEAIARQRDALTKAGRRAAGRASAEAAKAAGREPAFLRKKA